MKEIQRMTKSTVVYLLGNVGTRMVTFLLLPVYTKFIPPADLGTYDVSATYVLLISSVLFMDIWMGIMRFMFDHDDPKDKFRTIYSGLVIFMGSAAMFTAVFFIAGPMLSLKYVGWIYGYGLSLCFQNLYNYMSRALGFNVRFALSGIVSTLVNAGSNIIMIVIFKMNFQALYIAYILGILAQCIMLELKVKLIANFSYKLIDWKRVKRIFLFTLPLCVNSVSYWFLGSYNRIVINQQLGAEQNGYFALAAKFAVILSVLTSCFSMAWQEVAFGKSDKDKETSDFYRQGTNLYIKFLLFGCIGLIAVVYFIFPFFANVRYAQAKAIIPIYLLSAIASILSSFLGNILTAYKRTPTIFISTMAAGIVNVAIIYLLIGHIGVQAACISLLAGYLVMDIIRVIIISKSIPYRLDYKIFLYMVPLVVLTVWVYLKGNSLMNGIMLLAIAAFAFFSFKRYLRMGLDKLKPYLHARFKLRRGVDE